MACDAPPFFTAFAEGVIGASDYLFLYYSFMGSSVGDVAKVAVRTGMIMGLRELWQPFFATLAKSPYALSPMAISVVVALFVLVPAISLLLAPTLYRSFPLPTLDCSWALKLRFLMLLGVATVLEAFAYTSESSLLVLRRAEPFFLTWGTLYCVGLVLVTTVPMLLLAAVLRRFPSYAVVIVKAFACCSLPAVLLQCWAEVEVNGVGNLTIGLDTILFVSSGMGALGVFAMAVAVLATVGSRWRFASYTCAIGVCCDLARAASYAFARCATGESDPMQVHWMPGVLAWQLFLVALPACSMAVIIRFIAFFFFEQEATGMLQTRGHRHLVRFAGRAKLPVLAEENSTNSSEGDSELSSGAV
jgi:hypothetical protein